MGRYRHRLGVVRTRMLPGRRCQRGFLMRAANPSFMLALTLLAAAGCTPQQTTSKGESRMTHPNGLTIVSPPKPLEAEQTENGFRIRPENWRNLRSPKDIHIEFRTSQPAGDWPSTKKLGDATVHYRIDSRDGGS